MELLVSNPRRKKKRSSSKRRSRSRTSTSRRRTTTVAKKKTTTRRPRSRGGPLGRDTLTTAAAVGVGMLASEIVATKFAGKLGGNEALVKVGFAFLAPMLAKRFLGAKFANNMAVGAMVGAAMPFIRKALPNTFSQPLLGLDGVDALGNAGPLLGVGAADIGTPGGVLFDELSNLDAQPLQLTDQTGQAGDNIVDDDFAGVGTIEQTFNETED